MATKKTKSSSRATRTRDEVTTEFEGVRSEAKSAPAVDASTKTAAASRQAKNKELVGALSEKVIVDVLGNARIAANAIYGKMQDELLTEYGKLQAVREQIAAETAEIERLYQIDVAAASIQALVAEHEEKKAALEADFAQRRSQLEKSMTDMAQAFAEEKARLDAVRRRDQEQYVYSRDLARQKDHDAYEDELRQRRLDEEERQRQQKLAWEERESKLSAAEGELKTLRDMAAGLDARIAGEVKAAVGKAEGMLTAKLKADHTLALKDLETQLALARQEKEQLAKQVGVLEARNTKLENEVASANGRIENMAKAAFTEAGAARALAEVQGSRGESTSPTPRGR